MPKYTGSLNSLFVPGSIAIIGASDVKGKVGNTLFNNIINSGYDGIIYPVNIKGGTICGHKVFKSVDELPDGIDLGIIVIPAKFVREVVVKCGEKGFKNLIIISSGFAEVGDVEGEEELELGVEVV